MTSKKMRFELGPLNSVGKGVSSGILRDTVTGVQYLYIGDSRGTAVTPLLDKEGKPMIDKIKD